MKLDNDELHLLLSLTADFQLQQLRRLKGGDEEYATVRRLKRDLTLAGTAAAKLTQALKVAKS